MALVLADRVQQTGTANTTVSFTLSGSVIGFQSFAVIGNTNTTYYGATDASGNWEVGLGTYSTTGPTLTRTTILSSSNSGSAVTFSGTVNVFVTYPSERSVYSNGTNIVPDNAATLLATSGGTGQSSYAVGDLLFASTTTALSALADVATGNALISGGVGVAPSYGKIGLTTHVSGTLPVANGGTGVATLTGLVKGNGTSAFSAATAGTDYVTPTGTETLTNKRIDPRVVSATSASSLTPSIATADVYAYTALAAALTISVPTGTPVDGDKLIFRFLDNGTSRTITFTGGVSGGFRPIGISLTASGSDFTFATTINKLTYIGFIYNANAARWDGVALTTQA